jgi:hypothetical protein
MKNLTIGITTFSKRFSYLEKIIEQIRKFVDYDILITVNGDYNENFNNDYRKNILNLCLKYDNVYPIFFTEQRGLSKLWNTLIIHSKNDWNLLLNEDIEIESNDIFNIFQNDPVFDTEELIRINGSFSHFFVHKKQIDELGYFDERFLGFGEEDGDITYRYLKMYKKYFIDRSAGGISNLVIYDRDENIKPGIWKYSLFNRVFAGFMNDDTIDIPKKYIADENGIRGMFDFSVRTNLQNIKQYPYENFFNKNKTKL